MFILFSLLLLPTASLDLQDFKITYEKLGGLPPPILEDGSVCYDVDRITITPTTISRTIYCSDQSRERANEIQRTTFFPISLAAALGYTGLGQVSRNVRKSQKEREAAMEKIFGP